MLWGGHLEKRVGPLYFLIIFACALVFGAVIGNAIHSTPYLTVGASGATSGILGALLCLWILGRIDLQANFFAINIGLNIAFALSNSRIDWGVHLGGFAAGLIACAILDLVEKIQRARAAQQVSRIRQDQYFCAGVRRRTAVVEQRAVGGCWFASLGAGGSLHHHMLFRRQDGRYRAVDEEGISPVIVIGLAIANAAIIVLGSALSASLLSPAWLHIARSARSRSMASFATACSNPVPTTAIAAAIGADVDVLLYSHELSRGLGDIGLLRFAASRTQTPPGL